MPKPMKGVPEKSNDFKGSTIRLFKSLNTWKYFLLMELYSVLII